MPPRLITLTALVGTVYSHMSLWFPGPLGGAKGANNQSLEADPLLYFPLGCCDSDGEPTLPSPGVCRGHIDRFDIEQPQVIWSAGQKAYFTLSNYRYSPSAPGSTHDGGSCQVGFSFDRGMTWKAAASYNGNCPHHGEAGSPENQKFDFTVPWEIPPGDALFGWIWLNRERESFMNCAKVHIIESPKAHIRQSGRKQNLSVYNECHWSYAPIMETSYYTIDARCAPGAKANQPVSDHFEIDWEVPCGIVEGDSAYPIQPLSCDMHE